MRRATPIALSCLLARAGCAAGTGAQQHPAQAPDQTSGQAPGQTSVQQTGQAAHLLQDAASTLREMRKNTPNKMLEAAIAQARALVILPGVYQAGFLYSVHGGSGVFIARRADGGWGSPVFVSVVGAGYGLQAGLEKSRLVLTVMEDAVVTRILAGRFDFDTAAKYDILGVREETSQGSLISDQPVVAFGDGVGMMAGVALRGGGLFVNGDMTRAYYEQPTKSIEDILQSAAAPGMEVFALWGELGVPPAGPAIIYSRQDDRAGKP